MSLRIALIHPDLGIGGAERLVVDAALGLQNLGHSVDIYTSHHDPNHCFDETRDGTLRVYNVTPPFPRSFKGKLHILFAHARQLHLTKYLLSPSAPEYDVYFVDQLSTCIPFLRTFANKRVVFYCHFPDKLLADGEFVDGKVRKKKGGALKRLYRMPMDLLEEMTTGQADIILANSSFTARVFKTYFPSIRRTPKVVYPGINISAYDMDLDLDDPDIIAVSSQRPTLLSVNRFEKKKNVKLAIKAFANLKRKLGDSSSAAVHDLRLVLAGGYDPRLEDNKSTLLSLLSIADSHKLSYQITAPEISHHTIPQLSSSSTQHDDPDILFLLNFTTSQRSALLTSPNTLALLYTPTNEHFGIGPVEGMICGVPVLACNTGGPTESILDTPSEERTGWLCPPDAEVWAEALEEIVAMSPAERASLGDRAKMRAKEFFGMDAMADGLEEALKDAYAMGPVPGISTFAYMVLVTFGVLLLAVFVRFLFE